MNAVELTQVRVAARRPRVVEVPHSALIAQPRACSAWLVKFTQSVPPKFPYAAFGCCQ